MVPLHLTLNLTLRDLGKNRGRIGGIKGSEGAIEGIFLCETPLDIP
jgi:hypothetical protein